LGIFETEVAAMAAALAKKGFGRQFSY